LHTGECELVDGKTRGIAVHIGARVASHAAANDVLVSSTVKDLVAGSGIGFEDRGPHERKGIPGEWRLYAVAKEG
jgi:class 3 adenylate cyclase